MSSSVQDPNKQDSRNDFPDLAISSDRKPWPEDTTSVKLSRKHWIIAVASILLIILEAQLLLSVRKESQTFDESAHLYAGYSYLKRGDFGINPEHPPLVKLIAALPLLPLQLPVQSPPEVFFRIASGMGGIQFLYSNDADTLLFRARAIVTLFTLSLALLVFLAGYEMFGAGAGLFALTLFVFEPNILANGALITTDMGASCLVFATVYAFYLYCKKPSVLRLAMGGLAAGLALAAKHSTILLLPVFLVLVITEIARRRGSEPKTSETRERKTFRLLSALASITVISLLILWAFYGFRYKARPDNLAMTPPAAIYLKSLKNPLEAGTIGFLEKQRWLPEAYLYGLTDVLTISREGRPAFVLGHLYPTGRWFYFPAVFVIKSTLAFMILLALTVAAKKIWHREYRRELVFLVVPATIWFAIAMTSKLNLGLRHILPIYPFLMVLVGGVAWMLVGQSKRWLYVVITLLALHSASSLWAFPNYLPYSNEAFGGPSSSYKVVSDANVGWESGLKVLQSYLDQHHITHCWFAYDGIVNPAYYHIPCSPMPTFFAWLAQQPQGVVPEKIDGPVFIGSNEMTGFDFGPDDLNPYDQFRNLHPSTVLQGEILEFDGSFKVNKISALSHFVVGSRLSHQGQVDAALFELNLAERLDPEALLTHEMLASLYAQKKQPDNATREYQIATHIYQTVHPEFQRFPPENPLTDPSSSLVK
ncbi:tetratricopeptide repeat protein [Terriglobus saanensis]|uniref:Glycosyl transferase family 39 n=1 Tax=Terriglobus saanensis (strain ATCC BAA-1853 / DSM 23119 / SP1PR4) TaxID=401053 RepID=E8V3J8_TERSS|nr:glycosyltransferase family 39 protein [Terriglobus saanensis]ADV83611.1 glycosyl transferase family 39 [Terriglobus saanensis SP1PR4]